MTDTTTTFRAYNTTSGAFLGEWTGLTESEIRMELCDGFGVEELAADIVIEPVAWEIVADGVGDGAGERVLWATREDAEDAIPDLAEALRCPESDFSVRAVDGRRPNA